jgi:hypothetical protein
MVGVAVGVPVGVEVGVGATHIFAGGLQSALELQQATVAPMKAHVAAQLP